MSLESFSDTLIRLDSDEIANTLRLEKISQSGYHIIKVKASFPILLSYTQHLLRKKNINEEVIWEFSSESQTKCLLDTRWGKTTWTPRIEPFRQIPKIA